MFRKGMDKLFTMVSNQNPKSIKEKSLAIQSLIWYSAKTDNDSNKNKALKKVSFLAKSLASNDPQRASDKAYYLRGLIEAKRILGIDNGSIKRVGGKFLADFDMEKGVFRSQSKYSIDQMGAIFGAINALRIFEGADVDGDLAEEVFKTF